MSLSKYVNIPVFLISLAIGLFIVYIFVPTTRKIYVYPTPENVDTLQYKDATGACFAPVQTKTSCPKDDSLISKITAQT
jgi:hypothetical protein